MMSFVKETTTDEPVPDFPITATAHVRAGSIQVNVVDGMFGFDFEGLGECVDWLRSEVQNTGSRLTEANFTVALDDPVTPTKVTMTVIWTPPIQEGR